MIKTLSTQPVIRHDYDDIARYLVAVAKLCIEVSRDPRLVPFFIGVLRLVPGTIAELVREQRRMAA